MEKKHLQARNIVAVYFTPSDSLLCCTCSLNLGDEQPAVPNSLKIFLAIFLADF